MKLHKLLRVLRCEKGLVSVFILWIHILDVIWSKNGKCKLLTRQVNCLSLSLSKGGQKQFCDRVSFSKLKAFQNGVILEKVHKRILWISNYGRVSKFNNKWFMILFLSFRNACSGKSKSLKRFHSVLLDLE